MKDTAIPSSFTHYKQSGVALVLVLWMLALLTIMAVAYNHTTRTGTRLAAHFVQTAQARALAESGIWMAIHELLKPEQEQPWPKDNTAQRVTFGEGEITLHIQAETGKIDLNTGRSALLFSLIQSLKMDLEGTARLNLLQAILDWRDRDNLVRQYGAEDADYRAQGFQYAAKDGPFNSLDELRLVSGMTQEIYNTMRPALTIHSHQSGILPEVAPREVLLALPGITPEAIETYIATRDPRNRGATPLTGVDPRYFSRAQGNTFTISSTGHRNGHAYTLEAVVLIQRNSNLPYSVLSWAENTFVSTGDINTGQD